MCSHRKEEPGGHSAPLAQGYDTQRETTEMQIAQIASANCDVVVKRICTKRDHEEQAPLRSEHVADGRAHTNHEQQIRPGHELHEPLGRKEGLPEKRSVDRSGQRCAVITVILRPTRITTIEDILRAKHADVGLELLPTRGCEPADNLIFPLDNVCL